MKVTKEEVEKVWTVYEAAREARHAHQAAAAAAAAWKALYADAETALAKYTKLKEEYEKCINS